MKIKKDYKIKKIGPATYLLPYGQSAAEHLGSVELNSTGELIAMLLLMDLPREKILSRMQKHYNASDEDMKMISSDLDEFCADLKKRGILTEDGDDLKTRGSSGAHYFKIASHILAIESAESLIHEDFKGFALADGDGDRRADIRITVEYSATYSLPTGELLVRMNGFSIIKTASGYTVTYGSLKHVKEMHISEDGTKAVIYTNTAENLKTPDGASASEEVSLAIRTAFLYFEQLAGRCAIRSSSLIYRDKAILFCGESGSGKSLVPSMWKSKLNAANLNGAYNLIGIDGESGDPHVYGIPWGGNTSICTPGEWPLGATVLLSPSAKNALSTCEGPDKPLKLASKLVTPMWTEEMLDANLDLCEKVALGSYLFEFKYTKKPASVEILKKTLESSI
ncbi:MAG: PqqD family protein [Eubacterium sp.]|nr:PqqD family protein [Eubacterium sp.]